MLRKFIPGEFHWYFSAVEVRKSHDRNVALGQPSLTAAGLTSSCQSPVVQLLQDQRVSICTDGFSLLEVNMKHVSHPKRLKLKLNSDSSNKNKAKEPNINRPLPACRTKPYAYFTYCITTINQSGNKMKHFKSFMLKSDASFHNIMLQTMIHNTDNEQQSLILQPADVRTSLSSYLKVTNARHHIPNS